VKERERERERERDAHRQTERQRDRETERQRDRETERQRERARASKRERERERERARVCGHLSLSGDVKALSDGDASEAVGDGMLSVRVARAEQRRVADRLRSNVKQVLYYLYLLSTSKAGFRFRSHVPNNAELLIICEASTLVLVLIEHL
jgi:hypothetical protein